MNTGPHLNTRVFNSLDSRSAAPNAPGRSVERSHETITGCIDLTTTMTLDLLPYDAVVMTEKFCPPTITDFRRKLGGADDIREGDSRKYTIRLRSTTHTG